MAKPLPRRRVARAAVAALVERQEPRLAARAGAWSRRPGRDRRRSGPGSGRSAKSGSLGSRSSRYCLHARPRRSGRLSGFFSSAVKMGSPFRKSARSRLFSFFSLYLQLADDGEQVGRVELLRRLVQPAGRAEVGQLELAAVGLDALAQHVQRAALVDLRRQPLQEHGFWRPRRAASSSSPTPWAGWRR